MQNLGPSRLLTRILAAAFLSSAILAGYASAQEAGTAQEGMPAPEDPLAPQPPAEAQSPSAPQEPSAPQAPLAQQERGQETPSATDATADAEAEAFAARIDRYNQRAIDAIQSANYDAARQILRTAIAEAPSEPVLFYNLGCVEALAGNPKVAISALSNAVDLGFNNIELMNSDPDLKSLRGEPAFRKLYQIVATNSLAAGSEGGPELADIYKLEPGEGVKEEGAPEPVKAN